MNIFTEYQYIKREIKILTRRLEQLPTGIVHDYGIDYSTGQGRTLPLTGLADERPRRLLRRILEERIAKAEALALQVEQAIAACPDARTRLVMEASAIEGKTNLQIALELGIDERTVRRIKRAIVQNADYADYERL